ncbi:MAG: AAA family ATPase [Bacteroidales bacterium]|nr:AAA family ATPase [Bacteroidales bacterium]
MFSKGENIDKYLVVFQIAKNTFTESYVVRNAQREMFFLKLLNISLSMPGKITEEEIFREIEIGKSIRHPNIIQYLDCNFFKRNGWQYGYCVTEMVDGMSLDSMLKTRGRLHAEEVRHIAMGILHGLTYLHSGKEIIMHNNLNTRNALVVAGEGPDAIKLTHLDHLRLACDSTNEEPQLWRNDPFMAAPEQLAGKCYPQSDIFGTGAIMYRLLYGKEPWSFYRQGLTFEELSLKLFIQRCDPLHIPDSEDGEKDENLELIIKKALRNDVGDRFMSAEEMLQALNDEHYAEKEISKHNSSKVATRKKKSSGGGFADVAGLEKVKSYLRRNVLDILKNKDKANLYRINIPNGILLYGPPGCGKSFIAEKFAQEAGYHYIFVKSSDLASIFIHGTQSKIGALFEEARSKAPSIICFDEFDAFVPSRDNIQAQHQAGEVNEFLTQLNNCGHDNILVIATTNKPDLIDSAIMRRGRIDQVIYIPPPDQSAREELFRLYLKGRPCALEIDYSRLATLTPNHVASDIAFLANEAAISASAADSVITQELIERIITENPSSLSTEKLRQYEQYHQKFAGNETSKIGFRTRQS